MTKLHLIHLGLGNVGRELIDQIAAQHDYLEHGLGIEIVYCAAFTSQKGLFRSGGIDITQGITLPETQSVSPAQVIAKVPAPFVLIDTTASDETRPLIRQALSRGGAVVTANKRLLAGSQADYDGLLKLGGRRVFCEATVGAGLPVMSTIADLRATGDHIERITGFLSGTLGYVFSELHAGTAFSEAVRRARAQGFTEPDPREDLSGADVGRKAIILARVLGCRIEPNAFTTKQLIPARMTRLSCDEFMDNVRQLDADYAAQSCTAEAKDEVLRYVASVSAQACTVGLTSVAVDSDIGRLQGPDNIIVIQTRRYHNHPLVIKGPGAGVPVTAAAVFADIMKAANVLKGDLT